MRSTASEKGLGRSSALFGIAESTRPTKDRTRGPRGHTTVATLAPISGSVSGVALGSFLASIVSRDSSHATLEDD